MKKRGFTLIELLAVIVVLAIIALIATPIVMNVINDAKKGSAEASARLIGSVGRTHYVNNIMKNEEVGTIDLSKDILKYDGEQAKKGYIKFDEKGNTSGKMYIGGYCITLNSDSSVTSEKISEDECNIVMPVEPQKLVFPVKNGEAVYFNPTEGVACNAGVAVSTTGTKSGCMKFYAFLDNGDSETVKLILDHNTSNDTYWSSNGYNPDIVNAKVATDTAGWKQVVDGIESTLTARLISATEVNQIAPRTDGTEWSIYNVNGGYYLHTGSRTLYAGDVGTNTYAWLFDNTDSCTECGCNVEQSDSFGYWTSDYAGSYGDDSGDTAAWAVSSAGGLFTNVSQIESSGVRPVIEVSKKVFE